MNKINEISKKIHPLDSNLMEQTQARLDNLTKPQGSLGRLEELAKHIVSITQKENPKLKNKVIFTLASDHGVVEEGISLYPQEVTSQMVLNFINGGAGINVLARHVGARVVVADFGVKTKLEINNPQFKDKKINFSTKNFTKGPAMTKEEAILSIKRGIELVEEEIKNGMDLIGIGEMGIGNTTSSSAIVSLITGAEIEKVTGRGTGINDDMLKHKIHTIKKALEINKMNNNDAIDILSKIGGFEIGGMTGIILAAAANKIPVIIDGFISGTAALIAFKINPMVKNYIIASHCSVEIGHKIILEYIGISPLLNLNLRLGEGTGSALAMNLVDASIKILTEMATFKEANVSEKNK